MHHLEKIKLKLDYLATHPRYTERYEQPVVVSETKLKVSEKQRGDFRSLGEYVSHLRKQSKGGDLSLAQSLGLYALEASYVASSMYLAAVLNHRVIKSSSTLVWVVGFGIGVVPAFCFIRWNQLEVQ